MARARIVTVVMELFGLGASTAADPVAETKREFREAAGVTVDSDDDQWRRLTGDSRRDLTPMTQARMRKLAMFQWESNLLANRLIELPIAYLLADGVALTVPDPDAQKRLDAFWRDPINNMDIKLPKKVREMKLFGEQCWPAFVNSASGHVRLGNLDPDLIETVVRDPDNSEQPIGIVTVKGRKGIARRYRVIINGPEAAFSRRTQEIRSSFTDGDAFYFCINDLSGTRGRSDLLAKIDWLDSYEQFLFGEVERAHSMRSFIWDVTLKGATPEEVKARAQQISTPAPNSVRVHNDSETWSDVTPDLKAVDNAEAARTFRNHILGGSTIPEHWYGGGGDVNRSTGESMGDPTYKMLSMEQRIWKHILESVASFVVMRWLDPSRGSAFDPEDPDPELMPAAVFPEMVRRDTTAYAAALAQVVSAGAIAIDRGLLQKETVVRIIGMIAAQLGVEVDAAAELAVAQAELAKEREKDSFQELPEDEANDTVGGDGGPEG